MKKHATFFVCFVLMVLYGNAKDFPLKFSFGTGYNYYGSSDLKAAKGSYNETYAGLLSRDFGAEGIPFYYELGMKYALVDGFGMSLNYSFSRNNYGATFAGNGMQRHVTIRNRTPIDFGLYIGQPQKTCFEVRIGFYESTLVADVEYADGTRSISNMQAMNGTYHSFGFFYKADFAKKITGPLSLKLGIGGGTTMGSHYNDLSHAREVDLLSTSWFPTDFAAYEIAVNNNTFYDYPDDRYWKGSYFQFYAGLQFNLIRGND